MNPDAHSKMPSGMLLLDQGIPLAAAGHMPTNAALKYDPMIALVQRLPGSDRR
jgi:hypothetical protein